MAVQLKQAMTEQVLNQLVTVIIRSANERSVSLCKHLVLLQGLDCKNVDVIEEVPFSEALRKSYLRGIEHDRKWTLCVDADVLLRSNSISILIDFAERQAANTCEIQGAILDKFFGGARSGGIHLYRSELLKKAVHCIPDATNVRPEFTTLSLMAKLGFPWAEIPYVVGLHDFEQYYSDIYRKCFVHGHKHLKFTELLVDVWKAGIPFDADYLVALHGLCNGVRYPSNVSIDRSAAYFQISLEPLDLIEKGAINLTDWSLSRVDQIMETWKEPKSYAKFFPAWSTMYRFVTPNDTNEPKTLKDYRKKLGLLKGTGFVAGRILEKLGRRIQRSCNGG